MWLAGNPGLDALESSLNVPYRIPQNDGASMGTAHGAVSLGQLPQQPLHLVVRQRHVDLDGGVAGDGRGYVSANSLEIERLFLALELLEDFVQQVLNLGGRDAGSRGLHRNGAGAEGLYFKTVVVQLVRNLGQDRHLRGPEFDQQGHQHLLALRPTGETLAQDLLEQDALVGNVLIDDP